MAMSRKEGNVMHHFQQNQNESSNESRSSGCSSSPSSFLAKLSRASSQSHLSRMSMGEISFQAERAHKFTGFQLISDTKKVEVTTIVPSNWSHPLRATQLLFLTHKKGRKSTKSGDMSIETCKRNVLRRPLKPKPVVDEYEYVQKYLREAEEEIFASKPRPPRYECCSIVGTTDDEDESSNWYSPGHTSRTERAEE